MMSAEPIICAHCGRKAEKRASHIAKAVSIGAPLYCGRSCSGAAKSIKNEATRRSERIEDFFRYDSETGEIRRVKTASSGILGPVTTKTANGYIVVRHFRKAITGHRLAWRLHYGEFPDGMLDHINGDRTDNRICNLRLATAGQNQANRRRVIGKSGLKGVSFHSGTGRWRATIKDRHIGLFDTPEAAARAYDEAAISIWGDFAAPNFGRITNG